MNYRINLRLIWGLALVLLSEQHYIDKRELETKENKEVSKLAVSFDDFLTSPYEILNFGYNVPPFKEIDITNVPTSESAIKIDEQDNVPNKINTTSDVTETSIAELNKEVMKEDTNTKEREGPFDITTAESSSIQESTPIPKEVDANNNQTIHFNNTVNAKRPSKDNNTEEVTLSSPFPSAVNSLQATNASSTAAANFNTNATSLLPSESHNNTGDTPITTLRPPTTTNRPNISPGWFSNFLSRPTGLFLPNLLLNPLNASTSPNNPNQITFAVYFTLPNAWRRNVGPNPYFDTRPSLSDTNPTPYALWNAQFNHGKSSSNPKEIEAGGAWTLKAGSTESQPSAKHQGLHLYFPFRFPLQAQIVKETLAAANARGREVVDEAAGNQSNKPCEETSVPDSNLSEEVKSSMKFEFELPKPVVKLVKGVINTFGL